MLVGIVMATDYTKKAEDNTKKAEDNNLYFVVLNTAVVVFSVFVYYYTFKL
jgi:hypothetical protein